jgi:hypothetical protein
MIELLRTLSEIPGIAVFMTPLDRCSREDRGHRVRHFSLIVLVALLINLTTKTAEANCSLGATRVPAVTEAR